MPVFIQRFKIYILLVSIIIVAAVLRFVALGSNPPSLYWDEVSQGYNAYSILMTGKDEHQESFPLARFIAYGDYKAPVYIYTDVPFIALFGKTAFAVRFPSALFGTLTVLVVFFLIRELFFTDKRKEILALLAAFFLAISPWHIQLSRAAYEGNIATFFSILGILLFFLAMRKNAWLFILSGLSFTLGIYAFNSYRIFIPLIGMVLGLLYIGQIWQKKTQVIVMISICLLVLIPFIQFLRTPESKLRFDEVNIFSDTTVLEQANKDIQSEGNTLIAKVVHNRRVVYSFLYLKHYFDFYTPDFLFIHGDVNPRFSLQDNGELYIWELPLILSGMYFLVTKKKRETLVLFGWLLLAPVAGATARETPHALRGETFIPVYEIFSALGTVFLYEVINKYKPALSKSATAILGVCVVFSLFLFQYNYFIDYPYLYSEVWQDGYQPTIAKVQQIASQYDKIIFTEHYGRAYMYLLFYGNVTPQNFWNDSDVQKDQFGLYNVYRVGKYTFSKKISTVSSNGQKILYVVAPFELTPDMKPFDTIYLRNGHPGFILATK